MAGVSRNLFTVNNLQKHTSAVEDSNGSPARATK